MRLSIVRWLLSLPAGIFYCLCTVAVHERLGSPAGRPATAASLASLFLACIVALWVPADARQRRRQLPYDFGSFVFVAWRALVPIYLFATRGWRGFLPVAGFFPIHLASEVRRTVLDFALVDAPMNHAENPDAALRAILDSLDPTP